MVLPRKLLGANPLALRKPSLRVNNHSHFDRSIHSVASSRLNVVFSAVGVLVSLALLLNVRYGTEFRRDVIIRSTLLRESSEQHLRKLQEDDDAAGISMSSCILIMDDNHWLVEWLAYHYMTVNLRYIIVAIDGRSQTSPITILDRWKGRIDFELWNDQHFFPRIPDGLKDLQRINERRQQVFLATCMRELKLKHPNTTWVMFTDTDEFVNVNPIVNRYKVKGRSNPLHRWRGTPNLSRKGSVIKWIERERVDRNTTCFSMVRNQLSPDESDDKLVQSHVPPFLNGSDFLTLRWLRPAADLVGPKNILHLPSVPWTIMPANLTHQHRVVPELCEEAGHKKTSMNSLLRVHHYLGTLEQFHFRDDARSQPGAAVQYGRNTRFQRYIGKSSEVDDSLRPWLRGFIARVGASEAARLLEGVGRTHGWPPAGAHFDRYAFLPPTDGKAEEDADQEEDGEEEDDGGDDEGNDGDEEGDEGENERDANADGQGDGQAAEEDNGEKAEENGDSKDDTESGDNEARDNEIENRLDGEREGNRDGLALSERVDAHDNNGNLAPESRPEERSSGGNEAKLVDSEPSVVDHDSRIERDVVNDVGDRMSPQQSSQVVFSAARPDRAGAVLMDMMMAHAFAYSRNLTYGGACAMKDPLPHLEQAQELIVALGLESLLKFSCPPNKTTSDLVLNRAKYVTRNVGESFSKDYLLFVRSRVRYPSERHGGAVVHVRRGDVSPCGFYANRYLPNSYYLDIINDLLPPSIPVTILSESTTVESHDDFANYTLLIDSELPSAWQAMMTADFVVLSKSSFSFVPAMLNPTGTVVYTPFLMSKLPGWMTVPDSIQQNSELRLQEIVRTMCSEEEQEIALRKLSLNS